MVSVVLAALAGRVLLEAVPLVVLTAVPVVLVVMVVLAPPGRAAC